MNRENACGITSPPLFQLRGCGVNGAYPRSIWGGAGSIPVLKSSSLPFVSCSSPFCHFVQ